MAVNDFQSSPRKLPTPHSCETLCWRFGRGPRLRSDVGRLSVWSSQPCIIHLPPWFFRRQGPILHSPNLAMLPHRTCRSGCWASRGRKEDEVTDKKFEAPMAPGVPQKRMSIGRLGLAQFAVQMKEHRLQGQLLRLEEEGAVSGIYEW